MEQELVLTSTGMAEARPGSRKEVETDSWDGREMVKPVPHMVGCVAEGILTLAFAKQGAPQMQRKLLTRL